MKREGKPHGEWQATATLAVVEGMPHHHLHLELSLQRNVYILLNLSFASNVKAVLLLG